MAGMDNVTRRAHAAVQRAMLRGELPVPMQCARCGAPPPLEQHHPQGHANGHLWEVEFLCPRCHRSVHPRGRGPGQKRPARTELEIRMLRLGIHRYEVAQLAGLSAAAFSNWLKGRFQLRPEREQEVLRVLAELEREASRPVGGGAGNGQGGQPGSAGPPVWPPRPSPG